MKNFFLKSILASLIIVSLLVSTVAAYSGGGEVISPHAETDSGVFSASVVNDTTMLFFAEYGWCAYTINATYNEEYTQAGSTITLTKRTSSWNVAPSRSGSGAQAQTAFSVEHHNSTGKTTKSLKMTMDDPSYYYTLWGSSTNTDRVSYNCTAGYYGTINVTVYGATFLGGSYAKEMRNDFCLDPL